MSASKTVVVVGSSNTDMVIKSSKLPRPGETVLGGEFLMAAGGKGANQAVAAARAGASVTFVARVGEDLFGKQAAEGFEKEGIDVRHVTVDSGHASGIALIMVDENGENLISVAPGANSALSPEDIGRVRPEIEAAAAIVLQLEIPIPTVECAISLASQAGTCVILNPAPAPDEPLSEALLRHVDFLVPNESEAELLTGISVGDEESAREAGQRLLSMGVQNVIITRGAKGVLVLGDGGEIVPAREVTPVDTVAAGDAFVGAFAGALAEGRSVRQAVESANCAAAISVTRMGAQPSLPHRDEILEMLGAAE